MSKRITARVLCAVNLSQGVLASGCQVQKNASAKANYDMMAFL